MSKARNDDDQELEEKPKVEKKLGLQQRLKLKAKAKLEEMEKKRIKSHDMPEIDLKAKNFPPFMKCINFEPANLKGRIKKFSQRLWWGTLS